MFRNAEDALNWVSVIRWRRWLIITLIVLIPLVFFVNQSHLFWACVVANRQVNVGLSVHGIGDGAFAIGWWCLGVFVDGNGAAITALFTVVLAISTIGLWRVTGRTLEHSKTSSERQLRAYVFLSGQSISSSARRDVAVALGAGTNAVAHLQFRNTGQTPAYDVQIFGDIDLVPWPIDSNALSPIDFNNPHISKTTLGAGQDTHKISLFARPGTINPAMLTAFEHNALVSQALALVAHGEVRYKDAFGFDRWTRYRVFVGGHYGIQREGMGTHADGNESDGNES